MRGQSASIVSAATRSTSLLRVASSPEEHVHSAQQLDFFLHGLAVDVVYTLQQGVKAFDDAAILEIMIFNLN
uniref:AlNc14C57G4321 protein n=1 Tax=Albugo laibachii Nc14 TaxID=890382 RepID=F0WCE1_9STRA|nr:AlNc14C57G4321 [Albugo laibachii Nc14]|eukprot:CCA18856.1 AlNc14C57G4321 [Albugo laibachii Nc14]